MYIVSNAMQNLIRNKGRNLLLAGIILAVVVSAAVALIINNAAAKIIEDARLGIGSKVEIAVDLMSRYGTDSGSAAALSIDDYVAYADSDYLRETIFNAELPAWSGTVFTLDDVDMGTKTTTLQSGEEINFPTCKLIGNSDPNTMADFGQSRSLAEGRHFSGVDECIISEELAAMNSLSLGDVIHVESVFPPVRGFELTIVGIYADETSEYGSITAYIMPYINRRNEVLTSYETVMAACFDSNAGIDMKTEYYLRDPDDLSKFEAEVRAKGLPDAYGVSINQAAYEKVAGPLSAMKNITLTFMLVILILGAIVLFLISTLAIRERKYEVGVLRAMGMEKGKVALGILTETVVITAACLALGLAFGSVIAQPVANGILEVQIAAAEESSDNGSNKILMANGQTMVGDGTNNIAPISEIQVALGAETLAQIAGIALALAVLSGVTAVIRITKYEPMKILMERS